MAQCKLEICLCAATETVTYKTLLCLDLATVTGVAWGRAGEKPQSCSIRLSKRGDDVQQAPRSLAIWLVKHFREYGKPDLLASEHTIPPMGQLHQSAIIAQEQLHGAVFAIAGIYNVPIVEPYPATIRKHCLGQGRAKDGQNIKALVLERMRLLGYIPKDCKDHNQADACALYMYVEDVYCRRTAPLTLFQS